MRPGGSLTGSWWLEAGSRPLVAAEEASDEPAEPTRAVSGPNGLIVVAMEAAVAAVLHDHAHGVANALFGADGWDVS